jgi:hypothetical protein
MIVRPEDGRVIAWCYMVDDIVCSSLEYLLHIGLLFIFHRVQTRAYCSSFGECDNMCPALGQMVGAGCLL